MVWASAGHYASYIQGVLPFSHIINMAREDGQAIFLRVVVCRNALPTGCVKRDSY